VVSVNVGTPVEAPWAGRLGRTAIRKRPASGPVMVSRAGLAGDSVGDSRRHGGPFKAVYAFAAEDLAFWSGELGAPVTPGQFGENLTTIGIDVNEALMGERWGVGTALLELVDVRIPCNVFKAWLGVAGFDSTGWVKRFTAEGRPGPYLRVREDGQVRAGDAITVEHRPSHGVTVSMMFRALTTEPDLLPELLRIPELAPAAHERARALLGSQHRPA
jgi:MOSC domain-containing protein YiiM